VTRDPVVRLSFPAKADYLLLARLALSGIARGLPLGQEELADLKLAVTEACGNAVRHAYGADSGGSVGVAFVVGSDSLQMIVEDQGSGIAVDGEDEEEEIEPLEGGMGMSIIRAVMDDVDISEGADGRGTVVRMTKYLAASDLTEA
jgi:serine/threonine-protein kinase RsbW